MITLSPFGKTKRESMYRLVDEFSLFYHRFILGKRSSDWIRQATGQKYKTWTGYAFENLCLKHIDQIKRALGIESVCTEVSSYRKRGGQYQKGFQIDLIIDRDDKVIHLCECKYYAEPFKVDKVYAATLQERKALFRADVKTNKNIFTTLITNLPLLENEYALDVVDVKITINQCMF
jgi:uncharacterized protein